MDKKQEPIPFDQMLNQIIEGDCLEIMSAIPEQSIDLILCDLPYGVTAQNRWDQIIPLHLLWDQYRRIIKENGVILLTATHPFAAQLIMSNVDMFRYDIIWEKNRSTGFLNAKKMPLRVHESILVFYKKLPIYNPQKSQGHKPVNSYTKTNDGSNYGKTKTVSGGGSTERFPNSIIKFPGVNNDSVDRYHPVQKPIELFDYLVKTFSNPDSLVLDSCIGSGTTAISCLKLDRKFIGIEKDSKYCKIAIDRIQKYKNSLIK
jgi:DNA modification methylase